jgi:phage gp36-like protein
MCGYLNNRYDTAAIFSATGSSSNPVLLMHALAIVVYQLHASINPRKTPEHRSQRYQAAITWLEQVAACNINPPSLPKIIDGTRDYFLFGSRTKRNNDLD